MGKVLSMTGIGVGGAEGAGLRVRVILRSVNGRFFDLQVRCPQGMQEFEPTIRDRLQKHVERGKMSANLEREDFQEATVMPTLNEELARRYLGELRRLAALGDGEPEEPGLDTVARLPGVFRAETESVDPEVIASLVAEALEIAIREFDSTRETEGQALVDDLKGRLGRIDQCLDVIEEKTAQSKSHILERLRQRVEALLNPGEIDENRLATEVVLIADRSDIIEEIVGAIEDEFESEPPLFLADSLSLGRIVLGIHAKSILGAIAEIVSTLPEGELPFPAARIQKAVEERERLMSTYLGRGLAGPHARLEGLKKPVLVFARSDEGIPVEGWDEKAHLLFLILTPAENPRVQARLLARIGGLMESDFVVERLEEATSAQDILDAIRAGDPVSLG